MIILKITTEFRKGILFVRLKGRIGDKNEFHTIDRLIRNIGIRYLVLNINNLNDIDITCVNKIIDYNKLILKNKGQLFICDTKNRSRLFKRIPNIQCEIEAFSLM